MASLLVIRPATATRADIDLFLRVHDDAVAHLVARGSEQWGSVPFSQRRDAIARFTKSGTTDMQERDVRGVVVFCDQFPEYIVGPRSNLHPHDAAAASHASRDFIYLDDLVSVKRTCSKGTCEASQNSPKPGAALLAHAIHVARRRGKQYLYADCYCAAPFGLYNYYLQHGFESLARFSVVGKHAPGVEWPGVLLRLKL